MEEKLIRLNEGGIAHICLKCRKTCKKGKREFKAADTIDNAYVFEIIPKLRLVCPAAQKDSVKSTNGNGTAENESNEKGYDGAPQAKDIPVKV